MAEIAIGTAASFALSLPAIVIHEDCQDFGCRLDALIMWGFGSGAGAVFGVYATGISLDGNGGFGWTWLAMNGLSGLIAIWPLAPFISSREEPPALALAAIVSTASAIAATIGYEASSDASARIARAAPSAPNLSVSREGAVLSWNTSF